MALSKSGKMLANASKDAASTPAALSPAETGPGALGAESINVWPACMHIYVFAFQSMFW